MSIKLTLSSEQVSMVLVALLDRALVLQERATGETDCDNTKIADQYSDLYSLISESAICQETPPWHV